jgi:hypothetical protein
MSRGDLEGAARLYLHPQKHLHFGSNTQRAGNCGSERTACRGETLNSTEAQIALIVNAAQSMRTPRRARRAAGLPALTAYAKPFGRQACRRSLGCARCHASVVAIASASGVRDIAPKRAVYVVPSSRIGCVHGCPMSATPRAVASNTPPADKSRRGTLSTRGLRPAAWHTSSTHTWRAVVRAPGRWNRAASQSAAIASSMSARGVGLYSGESCTGLQHRGRPSRSTGKCNG